jgi:hypothetical protein
VRLEFGQFPNLMPQRLAARFKVSPQLFIG